MKDLYDIFTENERTSQSYSRTYSEDMGLSIDRILEIVEQEEANLDNED